MIDALPLLLGPEGYQISRSVRLRSSASAYFNRTPASAGNRQVMTFSWWMKLGNTTGSVFGVPSSTNPRMQIYYNGPSDGRFELYQSNSGGGQVCYTLPSARYRDPSAWYHFVIAIDTTQATGSNRIKWYVNGVQLTAFDTADYPSQNTNMEWNAAAVHNIGRQPNGGSFFDGYLTEVNFIDGQALTPSSFGSTNATTGVWSPIKYTGTYGTNGFYLNFSDNSAATAAAIGKDYSGNGNNWTPNNISVTAGVTYDSMLDVPTQWADGGNGRGNYSTLNPLAMYGTNAVISNASLTSTATGSANDRGWPSTIAAPGSGKWYAEFTFTTTDAGNNGGCGIMLENGTGAPGESATTVSWRDAGTLRQNATGTSYGTALSAGDIVMLAYDASLGRVWFGRNGTWFASGDPSTNANPSATGITTTGRFATYHFGVAATIAANFGQRPFSYTPPTGFKALNTLNLPTPTILKGNQYFDAVTWSGTNNNQQVALNFTSDFVWAKRRNGADNHVLYDVLRGLNKDLSSNSTAAEATNDYGLDFDNGPYLDITGSKYFGTSGNNFVAWNWKEGATQGFDIVTYTGTGSATTVAHNLGVTPSMIIVKERSNARFWFVNHISLLATQNLYLNGTDSVQSDSVFTSRNSTTFGVGAGVGTNGSGQTYVAYLFAAVAGYSSAFSYTGNGSADGPFVFLGFRPRWVLFKRTDSTSSWTVFDTARNTFNLTNAYFQANASDAEAVFSDIYIDILSNGFKNRGANNSLNVNGGTYIGFAMAESPFKFSLGR